MSKSILAVILLCVLSSVALAQPKDLIGQSSLYLGDIVIPENTGPVAFSHELLRRGWEGDKYVGENHYRYAKRTDEENSYVLDFWYSDQGSIDRYQVEWRITPTILGNPFPSQTHEAWAINCAIVYQDLIDAYSRNPNYSELFAAEGRFTEWNKSGIPVVITKEENSTYIVSTFYSKEALLKTQLEFDRPIIAGIVEQAIEYAREKEYAQALEKNEDVYILKMRYEMACEKLGVSAETSEAVDQYFSMVMQNMAELAVFCVSQSEYSIAWDVYVDIIASFENQKLGPLSQETLAKLVERREEIFALNW